MALRKTDRTILLERIDPKNKDNGMIDPKVFAGENNLHLVMDLVTGLWTFKYERGVVPGPLRDRFASPKQALVFAEAYLKTKNIKIVEVQD